MLVPHWKGMEALCELILFPISLTLWACKEVSGSLPHLGDLSHSSRILIDSTIIIISL